jgi:hypothetical protein
MTVMIRRKDTAAHQTFNRKRSSELAGSPSVALCLCRQLLLAPPAPVPKPARKAVSSTLILAFYDIGTKDVKVFEFDQKQEVSPVLALGNLDEAVYSEIATQGHLTKQYVKYVLIRLVGKVKRLHVQKEYV